MIHNRKPTMYDVLLSGIKMIHVAEHFKWIHAVILIFVVHSKVASILYTHLLGGGPRCRGGGVHTLRVWL